VPEATFLLIFTTSFMVALSGAMMPGPLLAITISEAARRGFWAGPQLVLGHGILELALIAALVAGLSEFMENELVLAVVSLLGGTILLVMGSLTVRKGWQKVTIPTASPGMGRGRTLVLSGVLVSISSPYWLIWWITLGMTYLLWSLNLGIAGVASFFTGHILADLAWYALVAFIVATGRKVMKDTVYRGLLIVCGLALLSLGGYFITSGVRFFIS
jgi:threonine/homoserine/homoserine lactone efflux protein